MHIGGTKQPVRIFFATDVHGSEVTFRKFINAARFYGANVLILGGDVTGKIVVPIVSLPDGRYSGAFLGQEHVAKNDQELRDLLRKIENSGAYPVVMPKNELDRLKNEHGKLDELFTKLMMDRLERWVQFAEERLKGTDTICYMTGGNDDAQEAVDVIKDTEHMKNPDGKTVRISDVHEMASLGWSNFTPWKTPRECGEEELHEKIEKMVASIQDMSNAVFNFHVPPVDSMLDGAPKLDTSVYPPRPVMAGGQMMYFGAGSKAVRDAIQKYQPLLGLHGHIHESRAGMKLGRTLCINPGSEYGEAILRGVIVELSDKKVIKYQFTSG
jgi:Icc-related predicted phosphoesterase